MASTVADIFLFVLKHGVFILALCLIAYSIGRRVALRFDYHSFAERVVFSLGLGLGIVAGLVFLAGIAGLLRMWILAVVLAVATLLCAQIRHELLEDLKVVWHQVTGRTRVQLFLVVLVVLLTPAVILALYPPTAFDATMTHLPLVKQYLRDQRISAVPFVRWSVLPQLQHMLFVPGMLFCDDVAPQLIQLLMVFLVGLTLYSWGVRHFTRRIGLWAAALWLAHPMVVFIGTSAYVDAGLTFFLLLASYATFNWMRENNGAAGWLALAAIFSGFAAGTKYAALSFLGLFGLMILLHSIRCRRWSAPFVYAVIAASVAAPWYLYNYHQTGNPVFPLMGDRFGYSFWSQSDLNAQMVELNTHGLGRSLSSLFWLPWNLAFYQQKFLLEAPYLPFHLLFLPFLIVGLLSRSIRQLLIVIVASVVFWFNSAQVLRYLLPVVPHLSLAGAASLALVLSRLRLAAGVRRKEALTLILLVLTILPGTVYALIKINLQGRLPYDRSSRNKYLSTQLIQYPALQYLNEERGRDYTLYVFQAPRMVYFADGNFRGDWFGEARFPGILDETSQVVKIKEGRGLYEKLRSLKVTHLLITSPYSRIEVSRDIPYQNHLLRLVEMLKMDNSLRTRRLARFELPTDQFFQSHFKLVYARSYNRLFELTDAPLGLKPDEERLQNPGFETLDASGVPSWVTGRESVLERSGHESSIALRCGDRVSCLSQTVEVETGHTYRLSNYARAIEGGTEMILGVSWIDSEGRLIETDREFFLVEGEWRPYEIVATAPPSAVMARIVTASDEGRPLLLDDYSFTRPGYR